MTDAPTPRLGELLIAHDQLTREQLDHLLTVQQTDGRPLGVLAEELLGVAPEAVEAAWEAQYRSMPVHVDLDAVTLDKSLADRIDTRQAWQFQVLPLHHAESTLAGRALVVATSAKRLARASAFAWNHFGEPVHLVIANEHQLRRHLDARYPWPAGRSLLHGQAAGRVTTPKTEEAFAA